MTETLFIETDWTDPVEWSTWTRLYAYPRICRKPMERWGPREIECFARSRARFAASEVGQAEIEMAMNLRPEIGRYEGVRFCPTYPSETVGE